MIGPLTRRAVLAALALAGAGLVEADARQEARVVAVADVHGALESFEAILRRAELIDAANRWTGGKAMLVQTGDLTDRGRGVRGVLDLLMSLEGPARAAGGRVTVLLGNHEIMTLIGDPRDVGAEAYETFVDGQSEARRLRAWDDYEALARLRAADAANGAEAAAVYGQTREAWMAAHPPGWLEYREAFGPRGTYGTWLRRRPVFAVAADTLFMHAGISPMAATPLRAADADRQVRGEIRRFDRFRERLVSARLALPFFSFDEVLQVAASQVRAANAVVEAAKEKGSQPDFSGFDVEVLRESAGVLDMADWAILAEDGPMWYRGYALADEAVLDGPVTALLQRNRVRRIAVGHTPQRDGQMTARLGGRIVLMDTGMLASAYKGRASALDLRGGRATALYLDGDQALPSPPSR